jgi:hypothetical protein
MTQYYIKLREHLDNRWETIFPGFNFRHEMNPEDQPTTVMTGEVTDQAALYGIISRLRNLGVELISVQPLNNEAESDEEKN